MYFHQNSILFYFLTDSSHYCGLHSSISSTWFIWFEYSCQNSGQLKHHSDRVRCWKKIFYVSPLSQVSIIRIIEGHLPKYKRSCKVTLIFGCCTWKQGAGVRMSYKTQRVVFDTGACFCVCDTNCSHTIWFRNKIDCFLAQMAETSSTQSDVVIGSPFTHYCVWKPASFSFAPDWLSAYIWLQQRAFMLFWIIWLPDQDPVRLNRLTM